MTRRRRFLWPVLAAVGVGVLVWAGFGSGPREIGRTASADGSATVAIGHPRLFGILGVEITFAVVDRNGKELLSTGVKDSCQSWSEARRKHATPHAMTAPGAMPAQ
ncbi:MAG: hypothetical protein HY290_11600 [Planctomycetia bacterium]|nr:hypothetical protein [Planctomycetia bacterium]